MSVPKTPDGRHREEAAVFAYPVSKDGEAGSEAQSRLGKAYFDLRKHWNTEEPLVIGKDGCGSGTIHGRKYEKMMFWRQGI